MMQYRQFGNTGLKVSEIGFGAWAIGGNAMIGSTAIGWGESDDRESIAAIHHALDVGINFFDTADIYGLGHSEKLIGDTIGNRKGIVIATKVGNVSRDNNFTTDYSKEYILSACEKSLRRLKRDQIEYYQLHTARLAQLEEGVCIDAMQLLQKQGKIRYWGLSLNTFDPVPEAEFLMKEKMGNGFQLVLNLVNQKALPLLKPAHDAGYGIIARMPLQFGLLTGKFDQQQNFSDTDHRKKRVTKEVVEAVNVALAPVWDLCKKYNCSKSELAMSFVLSYPELSVVIPGIRTTKHVDDNIAGLFQLEGADINLIESLGTPVLKETMALIQKQG